MDMRRLVLRHRRSKAALARLEVDRGVAARLESGVDEAASAVQAVRAADLRDASAAATAVGGTTQAVEERDVDGAVLQDRAAEFQLRAFEYEYDADQGGTQTGTRDELRAMAAGARAQAQQYHDEAAADATGGPAADIGSDRGGVMAHEYDSAERRQATAVQLRRGGVPDEAVEVAMRADVAHARPGTDALTTTRTAVPRTTASRARARGAERPDRSR